jgi:hypothetical protein
MLSKAPKGSAAKLCFAALPFGVWGVCVEAGAAKPRLLGADSGHWIVKVTVLESPAMAAPQFLTITIALMGAAVELK